MPRLAVASPLTDRERSLGDQLGGNPVVTAAQNMHADPGNESIATERK
jgi:hypothetical protein